ncbi:MAG: DUF4442 domain-containing protein [Pseudomonadales bacterium]|nr:DUF4442 domain-containing protein [Pseudomonadales bacterium]
MTTQQFDLDAVRKMTTGAIPFAENAGVDLVEIERGHVVMKIPFEGNQNHVGIMYAGALFTLAEIPGGAIFMSAFDMTKYYPIVSDMSIKFLKPALTDVTCEATLSEEEIQRVTTEAEENGKSKFELTTVLKDASGEIVATTTGTYHARSHNYKK